MARLQGKAECHEAEIEENGRDIDGGHAGGGSYGLAGDG